MWGYLRPRTRHGESTANVKSFGYPSDLSVYLSLLHTHTHSLSLSFTKKKIARPVRLWIWWVGARFRAAGGVERERENRQSL